MGWILGLLIYAYNPVAVVTTLEVDTVELNTTYNITYNDGKPVGDRWSIEKLLSQTIGWKYDPDHFYHVDWWVWDIREPVDYRGGWWIFWIKPSYGDPVRVKARHLIRTETLYDPEARDREFYPEESRAGLYPWKAINGPRYVEEDYKYEDF